MESKCKKPKIRVFANLAEQRAAHMEAAKLESPTEMLLRLHSYQQWHIQAFGERPNNGRLMLWKKKA